MVEDSLIFIEMEVPSNLTTWKTFCKKKFTPDEILTIMRQLTFGIDFLHRLSFIHRDVHPSRIQCFGGNIIKFNPIGLPYNFKKLLKRENFSGHINYSAPELIMEKSSFSPKVDIWSIGCCLYYMILKRDPFDGKDPSQIKQNILSANLDKDWQSNVPSILRPILEACFKLDENLRPSAQELINLID